MPLDTSQMAEKLKKFYESRNLLESLITGLEEQIINKLMNGESVPGFMLNPTTFKKWDESAIDELLSTAELYGVNMYKKPSMLTINQAVEAGLPEELVNSFVTEISGKSKLVETTETKYIFSK